MNRTSRRTPIAWLILGGIGGGFVLCELITRLIPVSVDSFPPIYQSHPIRSYELRPLSAGRSFRGIVYQVNADGLRDRPYPRAKDAKTFRIIALGDSVTAGYGVQLDETFAKVLERRLNEPPHEGRVEVINFGVPGYNTFQEASLLQEKGIRYDPDVIMLAVLGNDFGSGPAQFPIDHGMLIDPNSSGLPRPLKRLLRHSSFYWFIGQQRLLHWQGARERVPQREPTTRSASFERTWAIYQNALNQFLQVSRDSGAELLVCYVPSRAEVEGFTGYEPFRHRLEEALAQRGHRWLDTSGPLTRAAQAGTPVFLPTDATHLSPAGNRLVAELLLDHLKDGRLAVFLTRLQHHAERSDRVSG